MPVKNPYSNTYIADLPEPEEINPVELLQGIDDKEIDLICVLGPTASGKTRYAVRLARELNRLRSEKTPVSCCAADNSPDCSAENAVSADCGVASVPEYRAENVAPSDRIGNGAQSCCKVPVGAEILSGDSRQIYRGMDIGTGKDLSEYEGIPYHLIDIVDAGTKFDLYQYQKAFEAAYKDIVTRGGIPILCGGSGLYLEAATCGYELPDVPQNPELRAELETKDTGELVKMLSELKQLHNTTDIDTRKRLIRALEIAFYQQSHPVVRTSFLPKKTYYIGTLVSREERNRRIDARLDARIEEGMIDEVRRLLDSGVPAENLMYYGLEYKFVTQHILGIISLDEMRTLLGNAIHQFAKRQMTWFRGMERKGIKIHWTNV